jgi:uncharacterized membrane protein YoaK (UPF0700 family)
VIQPLNKQTNKQTNKHTNNMPPPTPLPNPTLRYILFLILVFNSGIVESFSLHYLGEVFCGFATGTLIILGLKIVSMHAGDAIAPALVALGGFCVGSFAAGQILEHINTNTPLLRKFTWNLLSVIPFLTAATIVAGLVGVENSQAGQLVTLGLAAIAMGMQMSAGAVLQVPYLGVPLATGSIHSLFVDNPLKPTSRDKTLKRMSLIFTLILGSAAGTGLALISRWVALLFACVIPVCVIIFVYFFLRKLEKEEKKDVTPAVEK